MKRTNFWLVNAALIRYGKTREVKSIAEKNCCGKTHITKQ